MEKFHFDYIIVGNGLAGLQLALAFAEAPFFKTKQIALIDPDSKLENDKTWSFWEIGKGKWEDLVMQSWNKSLFHTNAGTIHLNFENYTYKSIRSIDFYKKAKKQLTECDNFTFITERVNRLVEENTVKVLCNLNSYTAYHVFDSRVPEAYFKTKQKYTLLNQHFKGMVIETNEDCFNPDVLTMMDYRMQYKNSTSFVYILPLTKNKALIEYTFFTPFITQEKVYDALLKKYIEEKLGINEFSILETEMGNIPMTTFPFEKYSTKHVTNIGTAGGWVKGSTGYSFKHTEKKVAIIIDNLKNNKLPSQGLVNRKFKFYDKIFLKVLFDENSKGPWIFNQFYSKNSTKTMFRFLDEESSFGEELKIMASLFSWSFIKAFFKTL